MDKIIISYFIFIVNICLSQTIYASNKSNCENIFTDYYVNRTWGGVSLSGTGSDLVQTATIREAIPIILRQYHCDTMVDAPCGDFYWMQKVELPVKQYTGVDVVKELIDLNQSHFGCDQLQFMHLDLTEDVIPKADLVLCRDCLVHLSYADITRVISGFKRSGSQYLLTTSFINRNSNYDIQTGRWHPLNLLQAPFNFPPPLAVIVEHCTEDGGIWPDKSLSLWRIDDLPDLTLLRSE
jgi:hypothetical protein